MSENALKRLKSYTEDIFRDKKRLIRILLIVFILFLALALRLHESSKSDITVDSGSNENASGEICVDIGGAVVTPGVYTVSSGTRLYEVIELAGGLISNADTDAINRAEFVEDGEKIIIPARPQQAENGEGSDSETAEGGSEADTTDTGISPEAPSASETAASSAGGLININYASKEELMTLPGIGEAKAQKIIDYRSSTRFRKKEDIKSVNGIGDAVYNSIKDSITV